MDNKINQSGLSELLAQKSGISKTAAEQFVKSFFDTITEKILEEGLVKVKGLGTFKLIQLDNRESVNVNTGERFTIEGHQKITFIPDSELKDSVNMPFSAFETVLLSEEQAAELEKMNVSVEDVSKNDGSDEPDESGPSQSVAATQGKVPAIAQSGKTTHQSSRKKDSRSLQVGLKILFWMLASILMAGVLAYVLWPLFANRIFDNQESGRASKDNVETLVGNDGSDNGDNVAVQDSEVIGESEDTMSEKTVKSQSEEKVETVVGKIGPDMQKVATETPKTVRETPKPQFVLLESDVARNLSDYSVADTVNYRTDGVLVVHVMEPGETLTKLALKYYGTKKLWPYIASYNKSLDMNSIRPGTKVIVPNLCNR